ncbi:glycosyltransferase family 4 protein [Aquabacter sp. L1I39]|uniref:glycosyltransferase family 4 protein n=1 Tax=Aquabacter sp. L1I39 TaxID=2820278 RepID=UPI001AD98F45|nr:glycosyltransferase family 4 protein [Aquabacter sp. L1I39]QTL01956.1 glycosyltransferase family 4 protein [Aquabacter sp. L1I39]
MSFRAVLAFPGDLSTPTGGYAYDRAVLAALPDAGVAISALPLPAGFPFPAPEQVRQALERLEGVPHDHVLLMDGLALGALPPAEVAGLPHAKVALVHHPLALEAGLAASQQARFSANERAVLATCTQVVCTSPGTGRTLVADYGVDPARLTVALPGTASAPRVPADGDPPRLLAVGSVIPRKGYETLVSALSTLHDLPWSLDVIGGLDFDPAHVAQVRGAIAKAGLGDRIQLKGASSPQDLDAAYLGADLFVHPSHYEGYGMVLAEALRRGLPLLCTTGGAAAETVPDGAGVKVPPGDATALAHALRPLIADRTARRALADAAFQAGQALPGWPDTACAIAGALTRARASGRVAA